MGLSGVERDGDGAWLNRGVAGVGAASFFSDAGHELATSVLPTFLTSTLHAGPAALGAVEGVSDALIGLSKLAGGPLAADPRRRGRLASGGYLGTAVATAAIGVTTAVWQVGLLRAVAWVSRGIRSPARDMLLTSLVPRAAYGRAFGVERAGDNAGAVVGPLLAAALVAVLGLRHAILLAVVPGVLAAACITVAARAARRSVLPAEGRRRLSFNLAELRRQGLARVLVPATLFEFGHLAATLLILRATDLLHGPAAGGRSLTAATSLVIVLYAAHNAAAAVASVVGGHLIDRRGARWVFATGGVLYVLAYLAFAREQHGVLLLGAGFLVAGTGIGLAETAESVLVARALPESLRSNGFGVLGLVQSLGDLGATAVAGVLWAVVSPQVAFLYATTWMAGSALAALTVRARPSSRAPRQA